MADDYVQVRQDDSQGKKVKTFFAVDSAGNSIEIQAVALSDAFGALLSPLTEATGQDILQVLLRINDKLAKMSGKLP